MKAAAIVLLLAVAACSSRVKDDPASRPVPVQKARIDLDGSAPILQKGETGMSTNFSLMLQGTMASYRDSLLALQGRTVEIKDRSNTLGRARVTGAIIDQHANKAGLHLAFDSPAAASNCYKNLGIWDRIQPSITPPPPK